MLSDALFLFCDGISRNLDIVTGPSCLILNLNDTLKLPYPYSVSLRGHAKSRALEIFLITREKPLVGNFTHQLIIHFAKHPFLPLPPPEARCGIGLG